MAKKPSTYAFTNAQVAKHVMGWETRTKTRDIHSADPGPYYEDNTGHGIVVHRWEDDIGPTRTYTNFFEDSRFDLMVLNHVYSRWTKRMKIAFGFWLATLLEQRVDPNGALADQTFANLLEYQVGDYATAAMLAVEKEKGLK